MHAPFQLLNIKNSLQLEVRMWKISSRRARITTMPRSTNKDTGFRHGLCRLILSSRFRDKSRNPRDGTSIHQPQNSHPDPSPGIKPASTSQPVDEANDTRKELTNAGNDEAQSHNGQNTIERRLTTNNRLDLDAHADTAVVSSDLWSAAYREAVQKLGDQIDIATLEGKNVAQLFRELEDIEKEATHESAFLRGLRYLRSIKVPLERFKFVLDTASPLTSIEPTATTVFGLVRSVTVIAISFATADLDFAKKIAEMLEQISYIDDCDTLGQKAEQKDIHQALVLVYQKILEFYKVALEILSRKGAGMVMIMALDNERLPNIVEDFLRYSDTLRKLVQKATWEIVEDIKAMLYDCEIARWLGHDRMSCQSQYHGNLQYLRADKACDLLLKNPNFINWYHAPDSQQLVIIGNMGCGKTVTMTYLVDKISQMNECLIPQPKTCYYYCRDDKTGHAVSIYTGLILSLLQQLPGLKKPFFEWYKQAQASGIFDPATNIKKLEDFLQNVLEAIERPVFIIIDGLDECDPASQNIIFKRLGTLSQSIPGLKTILSSRPQEEILDQLDRAARIELHSDTQRDGIIVEKTVENQLSYLSTDVKALIIDKLTRSAQGSAIWTKMIIDLIQVRKIRAFERMRCFLEDMPLPGQLSKLYAALLSRYAANDPENLELSSTALKVLAASHRPLSILELAWAVALGTSHHVTTVDALSRLVDHERLMSLIIPFVSHFDFSDVTKRQVRLTHQSVKEFIIDEWTTNQSHPQLQDLASSETEQTAYHPRFRSLEALILDICIRYLLLNEIGNRDLFSEEQVAIGELPQESDLFSDDEGPVEYNPYCTWETWEEDMIRYDPTERGFGEFFVYASSHWLEHFGASTVEPLPSLANITDVCQAGSTRLHNWTQQNCRPGCTITARFNFESSLYDPLSITALYGSDAMLRGMLANSDFKEDKFLPQSAMGATEQILQWGDVSRLRVLFLDDKLGYQLQNLHFFKLVMRSWQFHPVTNHDSWDSVFDLVEHVSDKMVQEQWGNEFLCLAAGAGCMPIIQRLMDIAQQKTDLRSELLHASRLGPARQQSIGEAVMGNHLNVVKYLLGQTGIEGHLHYRNARGENVLHLATGICNPYMFGLLIPRFQEGVFQEDDQGYTPLMRIVVNPSLSEARHESAKVLLRESRTGWKGHSGSGQHSPLRTALDIGDQDMGHVLVSTVDPDM